MAPEQTQEPTAALDPRTFARLYESYLPSVYAYVACRVDDRAPAEEVTASAFRRAAEAARQGELDVTTFGTFVFRVAATAVADHARRSRAAFSHGIRAGDFDRDSDHRRGAGSRSDEVAARSFSAAIDRRALRRAIDRLTESDRRVIVLHYLDGLTVEDQCAALGWTHESFARRFHGALRALHAALADEATHAA